jgi:glycosyltransferase involved in cell wall biosynthesis
MTKISIITAVYNSRDTVTEALDSVLAQTHPDVEMIIVDGGSTDGTVELLERYRSRAAGFVSERDKGIYDALNKGIRMSSGDVVGFLHSDDLFASDDALARIAAAFEDSTVDAVYGDLLYVRRDELGSVVRQWRAGACSAAALRRGWMPPHPTFYVRRSVYEKLGNFDTRYRIAADYDTVVRFLFAAAIKVAYVPQTLVLMRMGGTSNRSLANLVKKTKEDYDIIRKHNLGGALTLLIKNVSKLKQFWNWKWS